MKPAEVAALLRVRRPEFDARRRALARSHDLDLLRDQARRRLPRAVFDYVDGGADAEITLRANRAVFESVRLVPDALPGITAPRLEASLFGRTFASPIGLAPTGYARLSHPEGELAVARAARAAGVPYTVSTVATTAIEDVVATGHPDVWVQLYLLADRSLSWDLLRRCVDAGVGTLMLTVDTAVAGQRMRDVRNGLAIPPQLSVRTVLDVLARPGYWGGYLRAPAMAFPNLGSTPEGRSGAGVTTVTGAFEPALSWQDVAQVRSRWPGRLLLKGPLAAQDARTAVGLGADGILLSNHGGRQLDRVVTPLELLPEVREAVGDAVPLLLDSGVRHGADVAIAYALGADLVLVGRPYLYGLAVAGEVGVAHVLTLLRDQLARTMHLLGAPDLAALRARSSHYLRQGTT